MAKAVVVFVALLFLGLCHGLPKKNKKLLHDDSDLIPIPDHMLEEYKSSMLPGKKTASLN